MTTNTPLANITYPLTLDDLPAAERAVESFLSLSPSALASLPPVIRMRHRILVAEVKEMRRKLASYDLAAAPKEGGVQ